MAPPAATRSVSQARLTRLDIAELVKGPMQVRTPLFSTVRVVAERSVSQLEKQSVALLTSREPSAAEELFSSTVAPALAMTASSPSAGTRVDSGVVVLVQLSTTNQSPVLAAVHVRTSARAVPRAAPSRHSPRAAAQKVHGA